MINWNSSGLMISFSHFIWIHHFAFNFKTLEIYSLFHVSHLSFFGSSDMIHKSSTTLADRIYTTSREHSTLDTDTAATTKTRHHQHSATSVSDTWEKRLRGISSRDFNESREMTQSLNNDLHLIPNSISYIDSRMFWYRPNDSSSPT